MKKNILLLIVLFSINTINAQKIVKAAQFLDNQDLYVGKTITIWVFYSNSSNGNQLRATGGGFRGEPQNLWKRFGFYEEDESISINIPNKFFENNGALLPNVSDGGSFLATVYVYKGYNHKNEPKSGYQYSESENGVSLELVSIKRR
jgi:hypothetical protein